MVIKRVVVKVSVLTVVVQRPHALARMIRVQLIAVLSV